MAANTFGDLMKMHSFGESHGPALGVIVDGCPAGLLFDESLLQKNLSRRRPGSQAWTSQRAEPDNVETLSGVFEGKSLGTPIAMLVRNQDARSQDYEKIKTEGRRGHADDLWLKKFGVADHRGAGRASGRETVSRVMAGSVAQMLLTQLWPKYTLRSFVSQVGDAFSLTESEYTELEKMSQDEIDNSYMRYPDKNAQAALEELIGKARQEGLSYGAKVELWADNVPEGLGAPVFLKLKSQLAAAFMSVGATAAVEFGAGREAGQAEGSQFHAPQSPTSVYGGIRGGISTGERISCTVTFKPTSTVSAQAKAGRHDPCIAPRAMVVLESMFHWVLADAELRRRLDRVI